MTFRHEDMMRESPAYRGYYAEVIAARKRVEAKRAMFVAKRDRNAEYQAKALF